MDRAKEHCIYCERSSEQVPLISFVFKGVDLRICPQHLPLLIHDPSQLIGKLPGAEGLSPSDHND